jgi:hypothetical protein
MSACVLWHEVATRGPPERSAFLGYCGGATRTLHDLRRTARSLMTRAGVLGEHAERCLGHVITGVEGGYNRHEYYAEKKRAFEGVAVLIERIINPKPNVVQLHDARLPDATRDEAAGEKMRSHGNYSAVAS